MSEGEALFKLISGVARGCDRRGHPLGVRSRLFERSRRAPQESLV